MKPFDMIITTNSAGELSAYVKPAVEELAKKFPRSRIMVVFTPCQYATGRELEIARSYKEVSEVILPQEYKRWMLGGSAPQGIKLAVSGIVIHLGGDLLYSMLLSKKLKFPAIAYADKYISWQGHFLLFMVPEIGLFNKFKKKGVPESKLRIVSDLMVDSIPEMINSSSIRTKLGVSPEGKIISFLPGSRPFQTDQMLPLFLKTVRMIKKISPETHFLCILSPYLTDDIIKKSLKDKGMLYSKGNDKFIQTKEGLTVPIVREDRFEAIKASTLVLTIPGTNTAEIAAIGTPMISIFPLNRPEGIPLEGALDWLCRVPFLGMMIKRLAVGLISRRTKFFALPNIKTGSEIVPEIRGNVRAEEIAALALKLIKDPAWLAKAPEELRDAMGPRGAAANLADEVAMIMEDEK